MKSEGTENKFDKFKYVQKITKDDSPQQHQRVKSVSVYRNVSINVIAVDAMIL